MLLKSSAVARPLRTVVLGSAVLGLALTQQACTAGTPTGDAASAPSSASAPTPPEPPPSSSSVAPTSISAAPTTNSTEGDAAILNGERQIVLKPVPSFESILAVDDKGRLNATDGPTDHSLFVLAKVDDKYQIKTAKADSSGEPSCMGIKNNGQAPLTVEAAACDTSATGQLFRFVKQNRKVDGLPTYGIAAEGDAFLQIVGDRGLIAEEIGDGKLRTSFSFVDNGKSELRPVG